MSDNAPIRVLIVDDHEMVRRGLSLFLRGFDEFVLVGEAASGEEGIEMCATVKPDVVLMDIVMPGTNGIEATRKIREKFPHIQIITLTSSGDTNSVTAAIQAGATSYLLKNVSDDQLASAIRAAKDGQRVLSPEATQSLIHAATRPATPTVQLSEREVEVLRLMIEGLNNQDIAEKLYLSRSTVKYHIGSIFAKLGVTNRSEAIAIALKNKLIQD
jgi:NarL family two-component system response regulator LiaR